MKHLVINILLTIVVGGAATGLITRHGPPVWGAIQFVVVALMIIGFVCWTIARFQLGASLTVKAQARKLVNRGLYSKIRNPIYVFGSCFIAGIILVEDRPIFLLVFAIIVPFQIWRARKESQVLEATFGEEYRAYRASTWFQPRKDRKSLEILDIEW